MKLKYSLLAAALLPLLANAQSRDIETIEVTGDFASESPLTLSASASFLNSEELEARGVSYLDEILNNTANINFTAGASRGKFVQIRGVGLRSEFVDPINPSVGLLIDGINYSGLGNSALLFDVDHVGIYRGPQGTRFGADAMAGIIDIQTTEAAQNQSALIKLGVANHGTFEAGVAAGSSLTENTALRGSFFKRQSDGYTFNHFLNTHSQEQREQVGKLSFKAQPNAHLTSVITYHYIDVDNGYDGFSLDNQRDSVADQPGKDTLSSDALAINSRYTRAKHFDFIFSGSVLDAETLYSYDEDWTCNNPSQPQLCAAGLDPIAYSSTDSYQRDHERGHLEFQLQGKEQDWTLGLFAQRRDVELDRQPRGFASDYHVNNVAVFGHKVTALSETTRLITGLRLESYRADYFDSNRISLDSDETMLGGKLAVEQQITAETMIYTSLSRGYKMGGFNAEALSKAQDDGITISENAFAFEPEYLWNAEFGVKGQSKDKRHTLSAVAFYMHRDDMQLKQWQVEGVQFAGFTTNAGQGKNYGLEVEGQFQYTDALRFEYSVGYLDTKIEDFIAQNGQDMHGREQAQSPKYQFALNLNIDLTDNLSARVGVEGKDDYYFSDNHFSQAPSKNLLNASLSYYAQNWSVILWGRNLADEEVPVRGFEFGNNPLDGYATDQYVQFGEPRVYGLSFNYTL